MRIFSGLKEAVNEIERDLFEMGVTIHPESYQDQNIKDNPDFETKELQGYCYSITNGMKLMSEFEEMGGNWEYVDEEVQDRVSSYYLNPGSSWKIRKEVWEQFLHNGKFAYTYNERFRDQLPIILEQLKTNPNTRQAIITVYDKDRDIANLGGKARIPCSMYYQFLIRPNGKETKVDCIYTMRSCDFYTHFIYDIAMAMMLQDYVAHAIGREPGKFTHFIGSLHIYSKDYSKRGIF